ncbi:MAG: hypothetical protein AAGF58_00645 [Pseudomonadota bacterium]
MSAGIDRSSAPRSLKQVERLRTRIRLLERVGAGDGPRLEIGIPAIDQALGSGDLAGLTLGCLHEVSGPSGDGASVAFTLWLAGRIAESEKVLWVGCGAPPYPPGIVEFGLDPARLVHIRPHKQGDIAWVLEEAARTGAAPVVVGDLGFHKKGLGLTASRRLQLACEPFGTTLLLLASGMESATGSTALSRWRIESLSSAASSQTVPTGRLLGRPAWQMTLLRARGGRPGSWPVTWLDRDRGVVLGQPYPVEKAGLVERQAANAA